MAAEGLSDEALLAGLTFGDPEAGRVVAVVDGDDPGHDDEHRAPQYDDEHRAPQYDDRATAHHDGGRRAGVGDPGRPRLPPDRGHSPSVRNDDLHPRGGRGGQRGSRWRRQWRPDRRRALMLLVGAVGSWSLWRGRPRR